LYLKNLKIKNFRNLQKINFTPEHLISYFYAPNGTGKTNVLEAIQCVTVGKTLRAKTENDIINFAKTNEQKRNDVHVFAEFNDQEKLNFTQTYFLEPQATMYEKNSIRKKKTLLHNKTKVSITDFVGRVPSIWFSPESIKIITSSPLNKREYFDDILIQLYPEYIFNLRYFNRALRQRNKLLQEHNLKPNNIRIWTEQLIEYGSKVIKARQKFFTSLNTIFKDIDYISRYKFYIKYEPNVLVNEIFDEDVTYRYRDDLRKCFDIDKYRATTSSGPHRDDWHLLIKIEEKEHDNNFIRADKFASRGQQRMALIVLQLALIKLFEKTLDKKPILLLDDIFSELDEENEKILMDIVEHNQIQSFITGVEKKDFHNIKGYDLRELMK
jgi:DNA replication and repair protein RecF